MYRKLTGKHHPNSKQQLTSKQKKLQKNINLDDRIECIAKNNELIILKDHKQNVRSATPCRLIC